MVATVAGERREVPADVVLVVARIDDRLDLVEELRGGGVPVHPVGDCTGAGYIEGALLEATQLAVRL